MANIFRGLLVRAALLAQTPFLISLSEKKKWPLKFFICCKGPLNTFKKNYFGFLKAAADDFFGGFLIFSFGPWRPLGARKKKKISSNSLLINPQLMSTLPFFD